MIATPILLLLPHLVIPNQLSKPSDTPATQVNYKLYVNKPVPSFDKEVLEPLRQKQAEQARLEALQAEEAARQAQLTANAPKTVITPLKTASTNDGWAYLRQCESGGNYAANTGNGYYGAYQYDLSTWGNYGGYARPDLAPPAVQDAKAQETYARRGASPWPSCGRFL